MIQRRIRKHTPILAIASLLLVAVVAVAVIFTLLPKRGKPPETLVNPYEGMVRVSDGSHLIWMTPQEGVAVSRLYRRDFASGTDGIVYRGTDFTTQRGVDLSIYQEDVDWAKVRDAGIDFALLRIGYRGCVEGKLQPDSLFESHYAGAEGAGLAVGVYFFSQALTAEEGQEEAEYVLSLLDGRALEMPVYFDWEPLSLEGSRTASYDQSQLTASADAFCRTMEAVGYEAGVYCNRQQGYYRYDLRQLADYELWVADPSVYPDFYYAMDVWQYSFIGSVPGISGAVDLNLRFLPIP